MSKEEFRRRFDAALEEAAKYADQSLGHLVPREFTVLLHGAGHGGDRVDVGTAVDDLYIDKDRFYRIIDLSVFEIGSERTTVFVRASRHTPSTWDETWNTPPGTGPFKQLGARTPISILDR